MPDTPIPRLRTPACGLVFTAAMPLLQTIARKHGYALAIHGTLARDADLICVPWVAEPSAPKTVVDEFCSSFAIEVVPGTSPTTREHGREVWTISVCFGECFLDLSFMPRVRRALNGEG